MNRKLRVAMFFSSDPASPGGVQEHIYYLSLAVKKLGHDVTVFVPARDTLLLPYPGARKIGEFSEIPLPIGYDLSFVNRKDGQDYSRIINSKKYDLLHIHDPFMPFLSWELLNKLDLPIITTYHATWEKESLMEIFGGFIPILKDSLSKKVKGTIFVSRRTKKCWDEIFEPKTLKTIIANGIDSKTFPFKKKKKRDRVNILFLARIVPKKGLELLLKAFKRIIPKYGNVFLSVVGEGPDRKRMMDFVKNNGLENSVRFYGYVSKEDKAGFYHDADIFCAPYQNEGFGITLLEAMATGTPIVALRNNAFSEVLKDYPAQELIVDNRNPRDLSEAIEELIVNEKKRNKIVQWEKREIKKYNWVKIGKETVEFYKKVLSKI